MMPEEAGHERTCRTAIVATLGPASSTTEMVGRLIEAGMSVARLNFSHGRHEDHEKTARIVRAEAERLGRQVALMQDLQGPKLRLGDLPAPRPLVEGSEVLLACGVTGAGREADLGERERLPVAYPDLARDTHPGAHILIDDGKIDLEVLSIDGPLVRCRVLDGGTVTAHKGINLPGQAVSAKSLSSKDLDDLRFGLALGVDYVAVSFVRRPADLEAARLVMREAGSRVPLVAKIERPEALEHLAGIIETADVLMVARGDLGVELPIEEVPGAQKRIIRQAGQHGVPVITATQMLESMVHEATPTRAEATDVANAVHDGTDAVMLSAETASGLHPVRAVEVMRRICAAAERDEIESRTKSGPRTHCLRGPAHAIARASCLTADEIEARAIIAFTRTGLTARLLSKERPGQMIIAATPRTPIARRMALYRGVHPITVGEPEGLDELMQTLEQAALRTGLLKPGDLTVILARASGNTAAGINLMQIRRIGGAGSGAGS